jgi:hypothetical protein
MHHAEHLVAERREITEREEVVRTPNTYISQETPYQTNLMQAEKEEWEGESRINGLKSERNEAED